MPGLVGADESWFLRAPVVVGVDQSWLVCASLGWCGPVLDGAVLVGAG